MSFSSAEEARDWKAEQNERWKDYDWDGWN
jgi:hypothetical protein